ncbi:hypothetical protein HOLDEFILI_03376 [Holdemania filiformis DSM 12042]|uniref:Uncharacterized protein n=1 Tax=Holdemania filiformis DSM 12042 TaxID=545696 RepID=B9YC19_9FIRM|nr:hypothetical protein HOLDEFILI_03376 [Holdemania filiformis DSM 12042]
MCAGCKRILPLSWTRSFLFPRFLLLHWYFLSRCQTEERKRRETDKCWLSLRQAFVSFLIGCFVCACFMVK